MKTGYRNWRKKWALILLCVPMFGCAIHTVNTDVAPSVTGHEYFSDHSPSGNPTDNNTSGPLDRPWWSAFNMPELDILIRQAIANNQDVAQAIARIRQAESIVRQTRSHTFPQIDLQGHIQYPLAGADDYRLEGEIGGALEWEIDVFNRIDAAVEADRLEAQAFAADAEAVKLSMSAAVARAYFGAVAANQALELLDQQVRTDQELLSLLELRFENGFGTTVDILQQQSRVADSESLVPNAQAALRVYENRLDVLLGEMTDGVNRVPDRVRLHIPEALPPIGPVADLLENRPDLRAARANLIASDLDIKAAIANRLPRLTLDGSYAYSDTAEAAGPVSMIAGHLLMPLLDWGRRKAEVERNKAVYQERLAAFTQTYLSAVEQVENAMYQEKRQREFISGLEKRQVLLKRLVDETEARYTEGVDDYLPVLNALQELRQLERNLIRERLTLTGYRIQLHRAVGGPLYSKTIPPKQEKDDENL